MFFKGYEEQLGEGARLGVKFYLLNSEGLVVTESSYQENALLPLASTKKIVIALAVLKRVFDIGDIDLTTEINITDSQFSPGRPTTSLDRNFFIPWAINDTRSIDQLLTYMLTESDNSSTDVLLELVGGVAHVNQLMEDLGFVDHKLSYSSKILLSEYFGITAGKSFLTICQTLYAFLSAYSLRPTELSMVQSEMDVCTPQMMADLLKLLVIERGKKENWIANAADIIFSKMEHCLTGNTVIKEGAKAYRPYTEAFGSKQGGLGGIRNDSAFLHLKNGEWAIFSIHTCLSMLPLAKRDALIADLAKRLLIEHCDLPIDESQQASVPSLSY